MAKEAARAKANGVMMWGQSAGPGQQLGCHLAATCDDWKLEF